MLSFNLVIDDDEHKQFMALAKYLDGASTKLDIFSFLVTLNSPRPWYLDGQVKTYVLFNYLVISGFHGS